MHALALAFLFLLGLFSQHPAWALKALEAPVAAASPAPMAFGAANTVEITSLRVRSLVPADASRQTLEAMGEAALKPFQTDALYPTDVHNAMWLKIRLKLAKPIHDSEWALDFQQNFLDRIELHSQDALGQWRVQISGDQVALDDWAVKGLYPRFTLPDLSAGEHTLWLKLQHQVPTLLRFELKAQAASQERMQNIFFLAGGLLGLTTLIILFSGYLSIANRDATTAWYTLFALCSLSTMASFMGIGAVFLWPAAGRLWEWSVLVPMWMMLALITQLQFCRSLFLSIHPSRALSRWTLVAVFFILVCFCLCAALNALELRYIYELPFISASTVQMRIAIFVLCNMVGGAAVFCLVIRSAWRGLRTAQVWTLAYLPLCVATVFALGDYFGWFSAHWMPYYAPMYCLAFEVPMLLLVLHIHHKSLYAGQVEKHTLARLDPLTGFLTADEFKPQLARLWAQCQASGNDIALAYIRVLQGSGRSGVQASQEVVRMLRTVATAQDTVACVQENLYAIVMPQKSLGEAMSARLSRLVALGMMTGRNGFAHEPYRFNIACGTLRASVPSCQELHSLLIAKLDQARGWDKRSIRFVVSRATNSDPIDSMQMSNLWFDALVKSSKP